MSRKDSFRSQTEFNSTKLLQFEKYQLEDTPPRIITEWTLVTDRPECDKMPLSFVDSFR